MKMKEMDKVHASYSFEYVGPQGTTGSSVLFSCTAMPEIQCKVSHYNTKYNLTIQYLFTNPMTRGEEYTVPDDINVHEVVEDVIRTSLLNFKVNKIIRYEKLDLLCKRIKMDYRFTLLVDNEPTDNELGVGILINSDNKQVLIDWNIYHSKYVIRHPKENNPDLWEEWFCNSSENIITDLLRHLGGDRYSGRLGIDQLISEYNRCQWSFKILRQDRDFVEFQYQDWTFTVYHQENTGRDGIFYESYEIEFPTNRKLKYENTMDVLFEIEERCKDESMHVLANNEIAKGKASYILERITYRPERGEYVFLPGELVENGVRVGNPYYTDTSCTICWNPASKCYQATIHPGETVKCQWLSDALKRVRDMYWEKLKNSGDVFLTNRIAAMPI